MEALDSDKLNIRFVEHARLGFPVACSPRLVHPAIEAGLVEGWYEYEETRTSESVITQGDRVLELGGGLGALATHVWRTCRPSTYDVFEANPRIVPLLEETLKRNAASGVRVHSALLTDDPRLLREGSAEFFCHDEFWAGSTHRPENSTGAISVSTVSFTEFLRKIRPTVIISDIEGGELELFGKVLKPSFLQRLLRTGPFDSVRHVIMEMHPKVIGQSGVEAVHRSFKDAGFIENPEYNGIIVTFSRMTASAHE